MTSRFVEDDLSSFDFEGVGLSSEFVEEDELEALGGVGSGNFGHAGRPGQVGGSADDGESALPPGSSDVFPADDVVRSYDSASEEMVARQEEVREDGERHREDMDFDTLRLLQFYQGGSYSSYNANVDTPGYSQADDVEAIQTAILEAPEISQPVVTYRGITADIDEVAKKLAPGAIVDMKGFQSTTFNVNVASRFALGQYGSNYDPTQGTLLEIAAVRGLHIAGSEDELLLPHGSRFRVVAIKDVSVTVNTGLKGLKTDLRRVIQLQQIDRDDYPTGRVDEEEEDDDDDPDSYEGGRRVHRGPGR